MLAVKMDARATDACFRIALIARHDGFRLFHLIVHMSKRLLDSQNSYKVEKNWITYHAVGGMTKDEMDSPTRSPVQLDGHHTNCRRHLRLLHNSSSWNILDEKDNGIGSSYLKNPFQHMSSFPRSHHRFPSNGRQPLKQSSHAPFVRQYLREVSKAINDGTTDLT